ncbi:Ribonucleotide reductase stirrup domain-containing protein [Dioscorea alata]|uniref:Ribonucleotide reductase stirrup domain-containing protein n=1 Tax=Dioscorea alata TaxID=55571 RepID=A0ACB7WKE3_DIOAL|nr:Ribonucleotide reductase stirrup domain-containing protein [Dioscorea alata]
MFEYVNTPRITQIVYQFVVKHTPLYETKHPSPSILAQKHDLLENITHSDKIYIVLPGETLQFYEEVSWAGQYKTTYRTNGTSSPILIIFNNKIKTYWEVVQIDLTGLDKELSSGDKPSGPTVDLQAAVAALMVGQEHHGKLLHQLLAQLQEIKAILAKAPPPSSSTPRT